VAPRGVGGRGTTSKPSVISVEDTLGFRLVPLDPHPELPMAVEAALPIHDLRPDCPAVARLAAAEAEAART